MPSDHSKITSERSRTDQSLRTEREKTDQALASRKSAVESEADSIVQRARVQADIVLDAARDMADRQHGDDGARAMVQSERGVEDEALRRERAAADESVQKERRESDNVLAALLPLEREKTDRYLVTERARSDDALAVRDDFLGMVSHDLRNLLGGIVLSAALLNERSQHDPNTVAATARIDRYAARMNRLIGDLVDVVSIEAGRLAVAPVEGDVGAVLAEALEAFSSSASSKGIQLVMEVERPVLGRVDHGRMLQVVANLVTNAIKFTPAGGRITMRCARSGSEVSVSVTDTGSGIAPDMLEAVFERFWQAGENDRRGIGLGLYISRRIVAAHGGRIWAESAGTGATFFVTLPA